jgi:hypothetical protein
MKIQKLQRDTQLLRSVEIKAITASFTSKINTPEMLRI